MSQSTSRRVEFHNRHSVLLPGWTTIRAVADPICLGLTKTLKTRELSQGPIDETTTEKLWINWNAFRE